MEQENINNKIFRKYIIDYLGKYHFYDEEEFKKSRDDWEYILDNLKESNRFDYNGLSFTFTKFGSISEGKTEKDVSIEVEDNNINVKINNETVHLDLIYKLEVKKLEDHFRIATRISEKGDSISCLLYINLEEGEDFIDSLNYIKKLQQEYAKPR
ncbi:hypothetical protein OIM93_07240 [Clostridium chauvoei]|uniref:hypothetical protein n=1 Tax=Clostridium chauvoei TaxID=46867 RepID=UPI0020796541|nr:hypothetical protein [Clostridium chauvoei]